MVLAAPAVRATVAEALRVGKTACHRPHFTAISGPVKVQPLKVRRSVERESRRVSKHQLAGLVVPVAFSKHNSVAESTQNKVFAVEERTPLKKTHLIP